MQMLLTIDEGLRGLGRGEEVLRRRRLASSPSSSWLRQVLTASAAARRHRVRRAVCRTRSRRSRRRARDRARRDDDLVQPLAGADPARGGARSPRPASGFERVLGRRHATPGPAAALQADRRGVARGHRSRRGDGEPRWPGSWSATGSGASSLVDVVIDVPGARAADDRRGPGVLSLPTGRRRRWASTSPRTRRHRRVPGAGLRRRCRSWCAPSTRC